MRSQKDPQAFAEFYELYADQVLAFLRRRSGNAEVAFDLHSETFAKALERRHQFRGTAPGQELSWVLSIARSELLHHWRDGAIETAALDRLGIEPPHVADPELERIDELVGNDAFDVLAALAGLPEVQRAAVASRVIDELPYEEVAARLGISVVNARARVSRGLRTLAEMRPRRTRLGASSD